MNPYLAFAAALACGLHGIENKLKLEPAFQGNAYEGKNIREVPKCLRDALTLLDKSKILRSAFGDDVIDHYLHAGEWEQQEFDRRVTDYERVRMNVRIGVDAHAQLQLARIGGGPEGEMGGKR